MNDDIEITPEMLDAAVDHLREYDPEYPTPETTLSAIFRAMLAASPVKLVPTTPPSPAARIIHVARDLGKRVE